MKKLMIAAAILSATPAHTFALAQNGPPIAGAGFDCLSQLSLLYDGVIAGPVSCNFPTMAECMQFIAYVRVHDDVGVFPLTPRCHFTSPLGDGYYVGTFDLSD